MMSTPFDIDDDKYMSQTLYLTGPSVTAETQQQTGHKGESSVCVMCYHPTLHCVLASFNSVFWIPGRNFSVSVYSRQTHFQL